MSAIGFSPDHKSELDQLREAYKSLNDVTRNIAEAQKCVRTQDWRLADAHLRAAEWHIGQAKQRVVEVGKGQTVKGPI